jgi:hypothetical protein
MRLQRTGTSDKQHNSNTSMRQQKGNLSPREEIKTKPKTEEGFDK